MSRAQRRPPHGGRTDVYSAEEHAAVLKYAGKLSAVEMATMPELAARPARSIRYHASVYRISLKIIGERHHSARYTDQQVATCHQLHDAGFGRDEISVLLGVNAHTIKAWIYRERRTR